MFRVNAPSTSILSRELRESYKGDIMLFIERDQNGAITAVHNNNPQGTFEQISTNDPQLQHFLQQSSNEEELVTNVLAQSDATLVRVMEDLVQLLIDRNIINFTDLPVAAQEKILSRQTMRSRLSSTTPMIEEDDII